MKKQMSGFIAGVLTTVTLMSLTVVALAATNVIEIQPINIMVNGKIFEPKDANGKDAMVFSYNGTTYAPLRALAETFGQTVGYDSEKNMATVGIANGMESKTTTPTPPVDQPQQGGKTITVEDLKSTFELKQKFTASTSDIEQHCFEYSGDLDKETYMAYWESLDKSSIQKTLMDFYISYKNNIKEDNIAVNFAYRYNDELTLDLGHIWPDANTKEIKVYID